MTQKTKLALILIIWALTTYVVSAGTGKDSTSIKQIVGTKPIVKVKVVKKVGLAYKWHQETLDARKKQQSIKK